MGGRYRSNHESLMTLSDFIADRAQETYEEKRTEGHDGITAMVAPMVAELLSPMARVLDIGCGQGPALEWFREHGFDVTGTTTNAADLQACEAAGFHEVYPLDMHDMGDTFPDGEFECIWARHVLEHSIAPFWALAEFNRLMERGGILYVEVPSPETSCNHEANQNHYSVMGVKMWISLIIRAGFEIVEIKQLSIQTGAGPDVYFSIIGRKL